MHLFQKKESKREQRVNLRVSSKRRYAEGVKKKHCAEVTTSSDRVYTSVLEGGIKEGADGTHYCAEEKRKLHFILTRSVPSI